MGGKLEGCTKGFGPAAAEAVLASVRERFEPTTTRLIWAAGSVRRKRDLFNDLDVVVFVENDKEEELGRVMDLLVPNWTPNRSQATFALTFLHHGRAESMQVDLVVVRNPNVFGAALLHWTGPRAFNIAMRTLALRKGLKLSQHGLKDRAGNLIKVQAMVEDICVSKSEAWIFDALGLPFIDPEHRDEYLAVWQLEDLPALVREGVAPPGIASRVPPPRLP